jgi:hypothetical protein
MPWNSDYEQVTFFKIPQMVVQALCILEKLTCLSAVE